jgi:hypothetical protein
MFFLKLSDKELLERFKTDWAIQIFWGVLLSDNEKIKDNSFVSRIRRMLVNELI